MCSSCPQQDTKDYPEKKYRLADFFDMHWDNYMESPAEYVKPEQLKAVNAMRVCRTPVLGVEVYACPDCGEITTVKHSCKNRFCPTCSWQDTVKWAERVKKKMLKVKHRHIVCTLPHSLHPLIKRNEELLLSALMRASAATFKDWFENKYRTKIGIVSVLHTYGEMKNYHPHTHMIVSWGGVGKNDRKLNEIKKEFVNYKFLRKKFRCKFEDELIYWNDRGQLDHDFVDREGFMNYIKKINKQDWQIHLEPSIDIPEQVVRYVGRYSKRACLSEYKITDIDGEYISFLYKDYRDRDENKKPKEKELRLHYRDFFPRLLQHVPAPYFRIVRYYGLYSNHGNIPDEYLNGETENEENVEKEELKNPLYCEYCNMEKVFVYSYYDRRSRQERMYDLVHSLEYNKRRAA
ncbi:MAG: transposase [Bacteroidales bacterium]